MPPPLVSVVIPAFDVAEHLPQCLESLLRQSIGFERIEVLAIDDGSRDATGELLDGFAAGRPNVTVLHQANSGGPGGPRNLGLSRASADHVFFLDPDDFLADEALERLLAAAHRNDADVVLGKMVGVGRRVPVFPFTADVERGDLLTTRAAWTLSCQKLFRREHVGHLRFLEGVRLGEDQEFVMAAYLTARVISVVASYPCYYLVLRQAGGNATRTHADPVQLYAIVRRVLEIVDRQLGEGPTREDVLRRYFTVEISGRVGAGILRLPAELRADYLREVRPIAQQFFGARKLAAFPALDRLRGHLLREGTVAQLEELAEYEVNATRVEPVREGGRTHARYPFLHTADGPPDDCYDITSELALDHCGVQVEWSADGIAVDWTPYAPALQVAGLAWSLALEPRSGGDPVVAAAEGARRAAVAVASLPDGVWALVSAVQRGPDDTAQLAVGAAGTAPAFGAPRRRLLGDRAATLYRDRRGGLQLLLARAADGFAVRTTDVGWDAAGLRVGCVMAVDGLTRDDEVRAQLLLRHRASGREVSEPAQVTRVARDEAGVLGVLADEGLEPGLWDVTLLLATRHLQLTGRLVAGPLPPPRIAGDRPVVPYATVHGNLSLDVGATRRTPPPTARAASYRWEQGQVLAVVLEIDGLAIAPELVLRQGSREVVLPLGDGGEAAVDVGALAPGTWTLWLQDRPGPERQARVAAGDVSAGPRRWWSRGRFLSAQPRLLPDGLALVVSEVSMARAVRRHLRR